MQFMTAHASRPRVTGGPDALTIIGFVLSLVFPLNLVGLPLSIVALVRARRAGARRGLAVAGIVIASCGIVVSSVLLAVMLPPLIDAAMTCARLGFGVHQLDGATYTCLPTSFSVVVDGAPRWDY